MNIRVHVIFVNILKENVGISKNAGFYLTDVIFDRTITNDMCLMLFLLCYVKCRQITQQFINRTLASFCYLLLFAVVSL